MSERSTLARPYADAVFRMAKEAGDLAGWSARLKTLVTIAKDARVARVINDPTVSTERLADFMIEVAGKVLGEEGGNLIKVLAENARLALLPEIAAQFENLKADDEGVVEATITSAQALTQAQIADLAGALKAKFKRDVTVKVAVDESLIGGAVIAVGDKVIDGSVKGRLERMSYALQA